LNDVIAYVQSQLGEIEERKEWVPEAEATVETAPSATVDEKPEDKSLIGSILNRLKS
jgi:hypothetical protein